MSMTKEQRQGLIYNYINCMLDNMDTQTMEIMIAELLDGNLQDYTDEQLENEIREYYPHLLEE